MHPKLSQNRNKLEMFSEYISKGALQSEVLDEVSVLEGGQFGAKFSAKFAAKFFTKFSGLFCWSIQSKKTSARTSAQNSHDSAQQNWRNFREKLHDAQLFRGFPGVEGGGSAAVCGWGVGSCSAWQPFGDMPSGAQSRARRVQCREDIVGESSARKLKMLGPC